MRFDLDQSAANGLSMLDQWGQAYHGALALPTPLIASQLSRNQIEELASYLSFVK